VLKHRFQKMLPELSGARSVAPLGFALRGDVVSGSANPTVSEHA